MLPGHGKHGVRDSREPRARRGHRLFRVLARDLLHVLGAGGHLPGQDFKRKCKVEWGATDLSGKGIE